MSKHGFKDWLDKIFPSEDGRRTTNELVERGLEALRGARDERAFTMGDLTRVPSRLELRVAPERYDELLAMDAARDLEFFFNDELMKDLSVDGLRTFGDHAVHVTVAADSTLQPDEIYAVVLAPEAGAPERSGAPSGAARGGGADSTRMLGEEEPGPSTLVLGGEPAVPTRAWLLTISGPDDFRAEERLEGKHWIIGRRGSTGRPLPEQYRKIDLDVRETISREQVKLELFDDRLSVERIGKAPVFVTKRDELRPGEARMLPFGTPFYMEDYEVTIAR